MSTSENLRATSVEVTPREIIVVLEDGVRHCAPLTLYPVLSEATPDELARWDLIGEGVGIHWPDLDEDVSVWSVVYPERTVPMRPEAIQRHLARNRERRSRQAG